MYAKIGNISQRSIDAPGERPEVLDCEIGDREKFGKLPPSTQRAVLDAIQSGKIPADLLPLVRRLKETGIIVCT